MALAQKIDHDAAKLAHSQNEQISRRQLLTVGLSSDAITRRAAQRRLHRIHEGIFSLVPPPLSPLQRASAAVLACAPDSALGGFSALALWWPNREWPAVATVYAPRRHRRPGIDAQRISGLTRADIRRHRGVRVTSPARTLLDCATGLGPRETARLLAEARRAGLIHPAALDSVLDRFPSHPGRPILLAIRDDAGARVRSEFEARFPGFCARHGLPAPLLNARVGGREVDAYFPHERLIVELDSWEFHRDRFNFEDDRERDADALAAGRATYRLTWIRFTERPDDEARRLRAILISRGSQPARRSAP